MTGARHAVTKQRAMATKRRTDHESTREPDAPAVQAASADQPASGGKQDEPRTKEPAEASAADEQAKPEAERPDAAAEKAAEQGAAHRVMFHEVSSHR